MSKYEILFEEEKCLDFISVILENFVFGKYLKDFDSLLRENGVVLSGK